MRGWKFESYRHMLAAKGVKTLRSDKYFSGKSMNGEWNVDQSYQPVKEIRDDEVIISSTYGKLKMTKEEYNQLTKQHENISKVPVDQIVGDLALMREEKKLVKEGSTNVTNVLFVKKNDVGLLNAIALSDDEGDYPPTNISKNVLNKQRKLGVVHNLIHDASKEMREEMDEENDKKWFGVNSYKGPESVEIIRNSPNYLQDEDLDLKKGKKKIPVMELETMYSFPKTESFKQFERQKRFESIPGNLELERKLKANGRW
jgi:hypothetical protein